jgi:predicted  nucleic acid-binding Zn-ribbon protein
MRWEDNLSYSTIEIEELEEELFFLELTIRRIVRRRKKEKKKKWMKEKRWVGGGCVLLLPFSFYKF